MGIDGLIRCSTCGWTRTRRPEDDEADRLFAAVMARSETHAAPLPESETSRSGPQQQALAFVPPPMPNFRRGAQVPAPPKPHGYRPPKEKHR